MDAVFGLWHWVARDEIWLPPNITWKDTAATPNYPAASDLYYSVVIAVLLIVLRFVLDRFVFLPIGCTLKVWDNSSSAVQNSALEKFFQQNRIDKTQMQCISRELNWTVRQIEVWLRRKKTAVSKRKKFSESSWHLTFYVLIVIHGLLTVWDKSWITNIADCFPSALSERIINEQIRWYYLIELGFYLSLTASALYDVRRKDFAIMMFHHVYTLILISISWLSGATYIGCLVMLCHDVGDIPLEVSKLFIYLKKKELANASFVVFFVVWCLSRLGYLPVVIVGGLRYSGTFLSPFCYYLLNGLLAALLCLHFIWTWMIIKIIRITLQTKEVVDVRSDDESDASDKEDKKK